MSLEEALNRNTEMMERLCSILGSVPFRADPPKAGPQSASIAEVFNKPQGQWTAEEAASVAARQQAQSPLPNAQPKSSDTTSGKPSAPTGESSSPANDDEAKAQIDAERDAAPALDYVKDVKPITIQLSKEKGREITIGVLSRFGVKSAQDLEPAQWTEYIAHCKKVLAGGGEV
jgi:hypothetical protein